MEREATQSERGDSWDGTLRRSIDVAIRVLDAETRSIEVVASDESLDSHGDVLKQFWNLDRYTKNPVVLWNHNIFESSPYSFGGAVRPEDTFPIGRAENVRVENGELTAVVVLGSAQYSAIAEKVFLGCKEKIIRAVSVGFKPGQTTRVPNADGSTNHFELGSAERPNELREISFVPMGSNPNAVAKSIAFERRQLDLMVEQSAGAAPESTPMAMTAEEKAALDTATAEVTRVRAEHKSATDRAERAEALNKQLTEELQTARAYREQSEKARAKTALDALEGKKFGKAEREKLDALVTKVGVDDVVALLETRADLAVTQPVLIEGQPTRGAVQPAPTPADGGDAGADIVAAAEKAAAAA